MRNTQHGKGGPGATDAPGGSAEAEAEGVSRPAADAAAHDERTIAESDSDSTRVCSSCAAVSAAERDKPSVSASADPPGASAPGPPFPC